MADRVGDPVDHPNRTIQIIILDLLSRAIGQDDLGERIVDDIIIIPGDAALGIRDPDQVVVVIIVIIGWVAPPVEDCLRYLFVSEGFCGT